MFDLDLLKSFVSVVDAGGFTRAGERVHRTQSTVSQQIRKLEEQAGATLINREGRGVSLTSEGEKLLLYARRILALSAEAASVVGVYGLTFAGIAVFAAPALFIGDRADDRRSRPGLRRLTLALVLLLAAADLGWGIHRLSGAAPVGQAVVAGSRIRIVQPNIDQAVKWSPETRQAAIDKLAVAAAFARRITGKGDVRKSA